MGDNGDTEKAYHQYGTRDRGSLTVSFAEAKKIVESAFDVKDVNSGCYAGGAWLEADALTLSAGAAGPVLESFSPINGEILGAVQTADAATARADRRPRGGRRPRSGPRSPRPNGARSSGRSAGNWRSTRTRWACWCSLEAGKTLSEGRGEVQEMIDVAVFAAGLSRQLYGLTMASERPHHRMYEQWQPLGAIGVITAFNFPVAVWSWNAFIAAVAGDAVVWKPSSSTPLTAIAVTKIAARVLERHSLPPIFSLVVGGGRRRGGRVASRRRGCRWSRSPVRCPPDGGWPKWSPGGWARRCWSWAATTR